MRSLFFVLLSIAIATPALALAQTCPDGECICGHLESLGTINAKCFGANGNDALDDTNALQAAILAAAARSLYIPAGVYYISAPLNLGARRVHGDHAWRYDEGGTVIRAAVPMSAMLKATSNPFQLEDIIIDGNGLAEIGLHTQTTHGRTTVVRNVSVTKTKSIAFQFNDSMKATFYRLSAYNNYGDGFLVIDGNASSFRDLEALYNTGIGFHLKGDNNASDVFVSGLVVENSGEQALVVSGVTGKAVFEYARIEANGANDTVLFSGAKNVALTNSYVSGIGDAQASNFAIHLVDSSNCVIQGNGISDGSGDPNSKYASIVLEPGSLNNRVVGNRYNSATAALSVEVTFTDRNTISAAAETFGKTPPNSGSWRQGDRVWNSTPYVGGPAGWICVQGGIPGVWAAMPALQATP